MVGSGQLRSGQFSGQANSGRVKSYEHGHANICSCLGQPLPDSQDCDQVNFGLKPPFMHGQVTFSMVGSPLPWSGQLLCSARLALVMVG
jgi:hypothetical protein